MTTQDSGARCAIPRLSDADGFVRLSLDDILGVRIEHLLSGLDGDSAGAVRCGMATTIQGFTEWASSDAPRLTLGWDWCLTCAQGQMDLVRVGYPRSNVMLVDHHGVDYSWQRNLEVLGTVVDALPWRDDTGRALARCTL